MRSTHLLFVLALLWAGADRAQAGFTHKLTHLSDLEMDWAHPGIIEDAPLLPPGDPKSLGPVLTVGLNPPSDPGGHGDSGLTDGPILGMGGPLPPSGGPGDGPPVGTLGSPSLQAESAPAPAGLVLAGIGIVGLIGYGRWRRPAV